MRKLLIALTFLILPILLSPPVASAEMFQNWSGCTEKTTDTVGNSSEVATLSCLPVVFHNVIAGFLMFVGAVALVMIVFSGYKLITSGGDPKKVESARGIMTYAIIGAVIVLSSFAILYFIGFITGSTNCITKTEAITTGGCQ